MSKKSKWVLAFGLILLMLGAGLWLAIDHYANLPARVNTLETLVLGQSEYVPGSQAALRVLVRDLRDQRPIADADVKISLRPSDGGEAVPLFAGQTDAQGLANVSFRVPEGAAPSQQIIVETSTRMGDDRLEETIQIRRDYRILLSTDKPLYQPGQVIHIRALALSTFDRIPASGQKLEFTIADGKGNKVFRKTVETSEYGVGAVDFQLASQVNTGRYKIRAQMGETSAEKTVTVEHYVLPKFNLSWQTDRRYYGPGDLVSGTLNAAYFFGKNVAGGEVTIEGFTFDFERQEVFKLQGKTEEDGAFAFQFRLPDYLLGSDLEGGIARFYLQARVTDLAQHTEQSSFSLPVTQSQIIIEAVPESGVIRQGVENILYILTSYPDGAPAETTLTILPEEGTSTTLTTGPYGLAQYAFTPSTSYGNLTISARDEGGARAQKPFTFEGQWQPESILLRPDKAVYRVGESMRLDLLTSAQSGRAYLDIIREGQTVSTFTVEIEEGQGEAFVDLSADHFGTLTLHAYKILSGGTIVRDTRLVVVDSPDELTLNITPDREEYRPGESAQIDFLVSDPQGQGVQSALGLAIVDESLFALTEQDPGFAKLYFLLESELLQPKYDIHGFTVPDLLGEGPQEGALQHALDGAAKASFAEVSLHSDPFSLQLNSHEDKVRLAHARQEAFFGNLAKVLFGVDLMIPLAIAGLAIFAVARQRALSLSLSLLLGLLLGAALVIVLAPAPAWVGTQPLGRLNYLLNLLVPTEGILVAILLAGLVSYLALAVYALVKREWTLGLSQLLMVLWIPFLALLLFTASRSDLSPGDSLLAWTLLAFSLPPLAFLLRSMGFAVRRSYLPALFTFLVGCGSLLLPLAVSAAVPLRMPGNVLLRGDGMLLGAAAMPEEILVEDMVLEAEEAESPKGEAPSAQPPRLRQYFPETLYWQPEALTDSQGRWRLEIPMADSITTWRLTALASSQEGRLGAATAGIRVFQDFFIDLDLPAALTQHDEISVPVGVFNYLPESQTVRLVIEPGEGFELLDQSEKELLIAANDIAVVYFRVKAKAFGQQPLKVTAYGSQLSDAIQKEVSVVPDGKPFAFSHADRLPPQGISRTVEFPDALIPGTQKLTVKIYPGVVSQVVEGLDSILRMPFGCFEQTSSITYPNVLVLDYLQSTEQASPETAFKAEEYINLGYQRLTTFEVAGGGFSLFGNPPADRMLTAYGLQEFSDMRRVYAVDADLIERAAQWLLDQQEGDGSWKNDQGLVHESTWSNLQNDRLPVTAYIVWSLIEAGYLDQAETQAGLDYIREHYAQAEDPYVMALLANALVAADRQEGNISNFTQQVLDALAAEAQQEGDSAYWTSRVATFMGSQGKTGSIETTALAAYALLRGDRHPDLANAAITYLVQQKDSFGTWHSTQATVLALKALIETVRSGAEDTAAEVTLTLNAGQKRTLTITPENFDVVQMVSFDDVNPGQENTVSIQVKGEGNLMYQVKGAYYLPWDEVAALEAEQEPEPVTLDVHYDRTELQVEDTVQVDVQVTLNKPGRAEWTLIDLGIPPGFTVKREDLTALVERFQDVPEDYAFPTLERYELTGRQILVYIGGLSHEQPFSFSYRIQAKYPIAAKTPTSSAYDYYNPEVNGEQTPVSIVVNP